MPELIFRNPENDRIHIGYIVRSEDKTQYTQEEEGKYIKKNVHVITLSQYDPSWTSLLFGIFIAIDLICAAFFGLFAYIFTEFWRNLFLMFFIYCIVVIPLLLYMRHKRLNLIYYAINPQPLAASTGKIRTRYCEFDGNIIEEYLGRETLEIFAYIESIEQKGFKNIEGIESKPTIIFKLWATESDVKELEKQVKQTGRANLPEDGIVVPENYYRNGVPPGYILSEIDKGKTLEDIKIFLEKLKSENKNIIDLSQLKLANSVFAIKFDDLSILKSENARLQTRLAEYVERDKKAVELIDYYRTLVSTLPGIGNRIEKILATYSLEIPAEKFERFLHIASGSETAEMILASAKSGDMGSEIEALKEALPRLHDLKSITSSLAEIVMLDPGKVSEILITLENKLSSGDEKTQQAAKEILQTMTSQLKDILKRYGAE